MFESKEGNRPREFNCVTKERARKCENEESESERAREKGQERARERGRRRKSTAEARVSALQSPGQSLQGSGPMAHSVLLLGWGRGSKHCKKSRGGPSQVASS